MMFAKSPDPSQPDLLRGEVIRHKKEPAISVPMAMRLREAFALGKGSREPFAMGSAEKLAKALAKWDGENQRQTLRWYSREQEKALFSKGGLVEGEKSAWGPMFEVKE